ncbi:MAG: 4-hydroxybenzoate octaprenyltransferase [Nitrospirae bacterium]|nr:4-hydroxybenzoate octaprenyltransferase [Nitrospirota bacterium]
MTDHVRSKLRAVADLIRLSKQYGTLLLMAPALWSLVIAADGHPPASLLLVFVIGAFVMRSAGCVLNDLADRGFDRHVERTKDRPLASGYLTPRDALIVGALLSGSALALALTLNPLALGLSVVGFGLAAIYPLTKRIIATPQAVMGAAFGWGALLAWAAVRNEIAAPAIVIFIATVCWAAAYDTIYALLDRDDDIKIGVRSSAIAFGRYVWVGVGALLGLALASLIVLGLLVPLGPAYALCLALVAIIFAYQTWRLRRGIDRPSTFRLFRSHAGVGFLILFGITIDLLLR